MSGAEPRPVDYDGDFTTITRRSTLITTDLRLKTVMIPAVQN